MRCCVLLLSILLLKQIPAQNGFHLVYKVTNVPADTNGQHLNTFTNNGNSINDFSGDRDNIVWTRTVTRKDQPKYRFDFHGGGYTKVPNKQLKKYAVEILGRDTINSIPCTRINVQAYQTGGKVLFWVPDPGRGYEKYASGFVQDFDLVKLNAALQKHNLIGFPLRFEYTGNRGQLYELVKAEPFNMDDSNFKIDPAREMHGTSAEKLKKDQKITDEQYKAMKQAEEAAKKHAMEEMQKK